DARGLARNHVHQHRFDRSHVHDQVQELRARRRSRIEEDRFCATREGHLRIRVHGPRARRGGYEGQHRGLVTAQPVMRLEARRPLGATFGAYFRLTKPRVIELLLVTAVPPMILAKGGIPSLWLIASVVVGGALAAGGANTINCWIERDRDQLMRRTHGRPLPQGEIVPSHALAFGIGLNIVAFVLLTAYANLLAASLTISATLFYVFVYTLWLQ